MSKEEILRIAADTHNILALVPVQGDGVFGMAAALKNLRGLVEVLQSELGGGSPC